MPALCGSLQNLLVGCSIFRGIRNLILSSKSEKGYGSKVRSLYAMQITINKVIHMLLLCGSVDCNAHGPLRIRIAYSIVHVCRPISILILQKPPQRRIDMQYN